MVENHRRTSLNAENHQKGGIDFLETCGSQKRGKLVRGMTPEDAEDIGSLSKTRVNFCKKAETATGT